MKDAIRKAWHDFVKTGENSMDIEETSGKQVTSIKDDTGKEIVCLFCIRPKKTYSKIGPIIEGFPYDDDYGRAPNDGKSGDRMAVIWLFNEIGVWCCKDDFKWSCLPDDSDYEDDDEILYNNDGGDILIGVCLDSSAAQPACVKFELSLTENTGPIILQPGDKKMCIDDFGCLSLWKGGISCVTEPEFGSSFYISFVYARLFNKAWRDELKTSRNQVIYLCN